MLKLKKTYHDFNDVERTEEFRFNLTVAEIHDMNLTAEGGLPELLQKIVDSKDMQAIYRFFKELVLKSYGEISPDGRRFMKTDEIVTAFSQTQAYSDIYMELSHDADKAVEFVKGILPKEIVAELNKIPASNS